MRAYVMTTGAVFGLLTLAHVWRVIVEGPHLATDLSYVLITVAAAGLCLWACRLLWRTRRRAA
jgi:tellurite resistance protein TehA-like permease